MLAFPSTVSHQRKCSGIGRPKVSPKYRASTIDALALDSPGRVPWWTSPPSVPLFNILVRVLEETNRHVGHADILREQLDGPARIATDNPNLPNHDAAWWENYRGRVERAATAARPDEAP